MRARALSEWLRQHEPVVQLLFRLAMLALLLLALGQFRALQFTIEEINDQLSELRIELTNIRSDLEDGQEDATPTTLDIDSGGVVKPPRRCAGAACLTSSL